MMDTVQALKNFNRIDAKSLNSLSDFLSWQEQLLS
jgi:hypothetical protein